MAAGVSSEDLSDFDRLRLVFGNISEDDCRLLLDEFGGSDIAEVTQNVYEALESSRFTSVNELVWHIKEDPSFGIRRSSSLHEGDSRKNSWSLARSKSSNTVNKNVSNVQNSPQKLSSAAVLGAGQPMPFSGTRNPIQIVRSSKTIQPAAIRPYLTKYMQDTEMRNFLGDIYENQDQKVLILLRGASGSGKSTLASVIWAITQNGEICSADNYFMSRNGQYKFNGSSLSEAHETCRKLCKASLARGDSPLMIDNTNTRVEEMMPYVEMAMEYNYEIRIVEPKTDWKSKPGVLAQKTIHAVPKRTIENQLERFEKTTAKSMVDRILRRQGASKSSYKPAQDLDWGRPQQTSMETWKTQGRPTKPAALGPMMSAMSVSSPSKSKAGTSSPLSTQSTVPFSWSDPPPAAPPSPLLLSDLVPDFNRATNGTGPKPKRTAKRNGNGNNSGPSASRNGPQAVAASTFEDPAHQAFEKLRQLFPTVFNEELERIFNVYEGDVDLCASALMDQGEEMTGSLDTAQSSQATGARAAGNIDSTLRLDNNGAGSYSTNGRKNINMSSSTEDDEEPDNCIPFKPCPARASASSDGLMWPGGIEYDCDSYEMILPNEFAHLLLCVYGHPDDEKRQLTIDELSVKVPADMAFEIYKMLYLNMHQADNANGQNNSPEGSTRSNSPAAETDSLQDEFNAMAISLSQMELETSSGDPQLASIIDIETKISQQTQDYLRPYTNQHRTMAQHVNFSMLKQEYFYLDERVIDEVFMQSFLNIDKTKAWLNEMYPQSAAQLKASKTAPPTSSWHLKYNPKDVKLYSNDDLKSLDKHLAKLTTDWMVNWVKMQEYYAKCNDSSNPQIKAHYQSEASKLWEELRIVQDEMQYYRALCVNARHKNDQILDLHGLHISGAMRVLKEFLQYMEEEFIRAGTPKMFLLIITGIGKHSKNGSPVIQPAVRNFLTQRKYRFHQAKPGSYTVILTKGIVTRKR